MFKNIAIDLINIIIIIINSLCKLFNVANAFKIAIFMVNKFNLMMVYN